MGILTSNGPRETSIDDLGPIGSSEGSLLLGMGIESAEVGEAVEITGKGVVVIPIPD